MGVPKESNSDIRSNRKASSWGIGDPEFVRKVLSSAEVKHLQTSRFRKDGGDIKRIALKIGDYFDISLSVMQERRHDGPGADARKVFAFCVCRIYRITTSIVGEFLGVGAAAVSAMMKDGKAVIESRGIDIQLF